METKITPLFLMFQKYTKSDFPGMILVNNTFHFGLLSQPPKCTNAQKSYPSSKKNTAPESWVW